MLTSSNKPMLIKHNLRHFARKLNHSASV